MKSIFSQNGIIKPLSEAQIPAGSIEAMYGFGVYETLKVRNGVIYFVKEHVERLLHSASCIELEHPFIAGQIESFIQSLVNEVGEDSLNIKILLMGASQKEDAQLYIFPLAPLFPKRSWYRDGVTLCSYVYERWMPQAKSLNMLPSYYYYTHAQSEGHYDALLVDARGMLREGTRTNIFVMDGTTIMSPQKEGMLEGVTLMTLEKLVESSPFNIHFKDIPYTSLSSYDAVFLSSTSTKIMPVREIDGVRIPISDELRELIVKYNAALDNSQGQMGLISYL
ncbi:aminotransferase class IV [Candidatus Woesebacteria bacterium]|nr:aminotransferase class IV [Candidatus Woesebacteria bacterium]